MEMCVRVNSAFGNGGPVPDPLTISTQWADANTRMEEVEANAAEKHAALGVPKPAVWQKLGYSPEQIAQFREDEMIQTQQQIAAVAGALQAREQRAQPVTGTPPQGGA